MFGQGPRARVHSAEYLRFMEEAWDDWVAAWTRDQVGEPVALSSLGKVRLLPGNGGEAGTGLESAKVGSA